MVEPTVAFVAPLAAIFSVRPSVTSVVTVQSASAASRTNAPGVAPLGKSISNETSLVCVSVFTSTVTFILVEAAEDAVSQELRSRCSPELGFGAAAAASG